MPRLGTAFALALVTAFACRSEPAPAPAPAPAVDEASTPLPLVPRRASPALGFLAHLDASHTSVLYLGDPYPQLARLPTSPTAKKIVTDDAVVAKLPDVVNRFVHLDRTLADNKQWIPQAIVIGAADSAMPTLVRALRMILLVSFCPEAASSEDPAVVAELPAMQTQLATDLEALSIPSIVVWVQFPGNAEAAQLFEIGASQLASGLPGVVVDRQPTSITFTVTVADLLTEEAALALLAQLQIIGSADDPLGPRMVNALRGLHGQASLVLRDDTLVVAIGPTVSTVDRAARPADQLGKLFDASLPPAMLAWTTWDLRQTAPIVAETAAMIEAWRARPGGRALLASDAEDLAGDMEDLHRTLSTASLHGEARVDLDDTLLVEIVEEARPAAKPIAGSTALALVPSDAVYARLDATTTLGHSLASVLARFEERLARVSFRAALGDDEEAEERTEQISRDYYTSFAPLRQLVLRDALTVFEPPYVVVASRSETITGFTLKRTSEYSLPTRIPFPELAFVGKPADMQAATKWMHDVADALARGTYAATGTPLPATITTVAPTDLGLGVPTEALQLDWIAALAPAFALELEPGVGIHWFVHGDYLVLSTSGRLSKQILSGAKTNPTIDDAAMVAWARLSGPQLADLLVATVEGLTPADPEVLDMVRAVGSVLRVLDEIVWNTKDVGPERRTTIRAKLAG